MATALPAQMVGKAETGSFLLKGGTLITVSADTIQGDLFISDGKIAAMGAGLSGDQNTQVIDCSGLFVYPGMIDGGTHLGLAEIGSISLTRDSDEIGDFTPHMKALTAVNPNSILIPVTRVNGITMVLSKPSGGMFPGTASLIHLFGYSPSQMDAGFEAIVLNFPTTGKRGRFDRRSEEKIKKDDDEAMKKLNEIWERASEFARIDSAGAVDELKYLPEWQSLLPAVKANAPVLIHVEKEKDILKAIRWVKEKQVNAIFSGANEGWRVADSIAEADIPVITGPVLAMPSRSYDRYDTPYRNAGVMLEAGVKVALQTEEGENVRNLPYHAGFAATYGMGKEAALRAVTLTTAEIFGVDDKVGSLDVGKIANVFVADGDPFETKTQILHLFIHGYKVPLESRQSLLYDEFLDRHPGAIMH